MAVLLIPPWEWTIKIWSSVLGYGSIGFWVFAQVPQMLENVRLQSCEGLALPFLINWFVGDLCNLIGCLLTDQRAFQTWTATYFCLMDVGLTSQYFYYTSLVQKQRIEASRSRSRSRSAMYGPRDATASSVHSQARLRQGHVRSVQSSETASPELHLGLHTSNGVGSTFSPPPRPHHLTRQHSSHAETSTHYQPQATGSEITLRGPRDGSMAALQEAALDVVRAAAKVERSRSRRASSNGGSVERHGSSKPSLGWRKMSKQSDRTEVFPVSAEEDGSGMMESFHSDVSSASAHSSRSGQEGSGGGKPFLASRKGKERSLGPDGAIDGLPSPALSPEAFSYRGRTLQRPRQGEQDDHPDVIGSPHLRFIEEESEDGVDQSRGNKKPKSASRSRGKFRGPSEKAAGVMFMGVFALVGWGGLQSGDRPFGKGLVAWNGSVLSDAGPTTWIRHENQRGRPAPLRRAAGEVYQLVEVASEPARKPHDQPSHYPERPDMKRIIGRSSAWICTTLYLTSRLPQIWKNFERKSTEGLSILLFIFAFAGNFTYVLSILLNPTGDADPSETAHYLLEALPYLLGSGGTLVFDLTIMLQTYLYGSNHPHQDELEEERNHSVASRGRKRPAFAHVETDEERRPLIRERSLDGAARPTLQHDGYVGRGPEGHEGQDVPVPSSDVLKSGEVTPRPGRA